MQVTIIIITPDAQKQEHFYNLGHPNPSPLLGKDCMLFSSAWARRIETGLSESPSCKLKKNKKIKNCILYWLSYYWEKVQISWECHLSGFIILSTIQVQELKNYKFTYLEQTMHILKLYFISWAHIFAIKCSLEWHLRHIQEEKILPYASFPPWGSVHVMNWS